MLRLAAILVLLLTTATAEARHRVHRHRITHGNNSPVSMALTTVQTAAGIPITVASHLATQFQSLISDFVAAGYKPKRIHCFARGGHVPGSRHYLGAACDFDGSLSRNKFLRSSEANRIIVKNHFRNGCSFYYGGTRDCGHIDFGPAYGHRRHRTAPRPFIYFDPTVYLRGHRRHAW